MPLTRAQLENPGDLWANIAKTVVTGDSPAFPFSVYAHRELAQMANSRVEVNATDLGRASDHMQWGNVANSNTLYYDHRKVRLAFGVVAKTADRENANYAYCLGRIGYLCARDAQRFTPANCNGLVVLDIESRGAVPAEDAKTDIDRTTCNFEITYQIPPSVFSAAT